MTSNSYFFGKRVTLAEVAAFVMNEYHYGDECFWKFNSGSLDFLGSVYLLWTIVNSVPENMQARRALDRNRAVRNSCKNTRKGRKLWKVVGRTNYPGISNAWSDVFELKQEFRKSASS